MWAIIKKEVKTYFLSPIGYIFIGTFLLMNSFFFYQFIYRYGSVEYSNLFFYTAELLTFTMFAGERKNGTETLLMTSSRSITEIVLGKLISAIIVVLITEIFSLIYYIIVCVFAGGITNLTETLTTLLGFTLFIISYISFGMFISSLTENQIIAGIVTVILLFISWYIPDIIPALSILSPMYLFQKYPYGILSITETTALVTQILMFTILTIIVMQRRKNLK